MGLEEILPFEQVSADLAGQIAGDLDRVGRPIGRCDPMIAAIALTSLYYTSPKPMLHKKVAEKNGGRNRPD